MGKTGSAGTTADHLSTRPNRSSSYTTHAELSPRLPPRRHVFLHARHVPAGAVPLRRPCPRVAPSGDRLVPRHRALRGGRVRPAPRSPARDMEATGLRV